MKSCTSRLWWVQGRSWGCQARPRPLSTRPAFTSQIRLSSTSRESEKETFTVTCGSSGTVTVDLFNSDALSIPSNPLVIYIPPAGTHLRQQHPRIPSYLFSPFAALARINYRWNVPPISSTPSTSPKLLSSHPDYDRHAFPTPLHDILHSYNELTTTILPNIKSNSSESPFSKLAFQKTTQRPILIYGSNLSGSLAASLALTETYSSKTLPTRIAGVITKNAIFDWTEISTTKDPESSDPEQDIDPDKSLLGPTWTAADLHIFKRRLFAQPSATFDNFVSPVLFFRTPGVPIPAKWPGDENLPTDTVDMNPQSPTYLMPTPLDPVLFYPASSPDSSLSLESSMKGKYGGTLDLETTRSAHLKFPPRSSGLQIPRSLFLYSPPSSPSLLPLKKKESKAAKAKRLREEAMIVNPKGQALDMSTLMKRSVQLHEFKDRAVWDDDLDPEEAAELRVRIEEVEGEEEEERVVREWIEDTLGGV